MPSSSEKRHPYVGLPERQFWKRMGGEALDAAFDPVSEVKFKIERNDKIVTAGSCFAQHVARYLTDNGFNHLITENAHPIIPQAMALKHNYSMFSARYGNIYTARQLLQLLHRAFGLFDPIEKIWKSSNGKAFIDPFRPQIQPGGYRDTDDLFADQRQHFAAIRQAITGMDIFVFTLGLTEAWIDSRDGSVYPLAPGVAGGIFNPELYTFVNFDEGETSSDLRSAFEFIRSVNSKARFIVTVSPVPLNATFEDRNCWVSTTYSKAVLRIAAENVCKSLDNCQYFPSYEIITCPKLRGRYYARDGREVLEDGVAHVMGILAKHFFEDDSKNQVGAAGKDMRGSDMADGHAGHISKMERLIDVLCDEATIDNR